MKAAFIRLCAILIFAAPVVAQSWRLDRARLCFVREEDNGAMNTLQSWIRVGDYDVPVTGGQAVCLFVEAGSNELIVTSTIPYDPHSRNTEACKSKVLKLELKADENRTFNIDPATNRDGYTCGWQIKQTASSAKTTQGENMGTDGTYPDYFFPIWESQSQTQPSPVYGPNHF